MVCSVWTRTSSGITTRLRERYTEILVSPFSVERFQPSSTVVTERYNYDASVAFDYSTYPVSRYVAFCTHSTGAF